MKKVFLEDVPQLQHWSHTGKVAVSFMANLPPQDFVGVGNALAILHEQKNSITKDALIIYEQLRNMKHLDELKAVDENKVIFLAVIAGDILNKGKQWIIENHGLIANINYQEAAHKGVLH
jgi:hypothetical protein